jgi:hypothetical protein
MKSFLAEKTIESSSYEIRSGKLGELNLVVEKNWQIITKKEIEVHIKEFIAILKDALINSNHVFFSYY